MRETKFLQMYSFSIILTSLHSFNLSFSLFYVISAAIPKFPPKFPANPHWFSAFLFHPSQFLVTEFLISTFTGGLLSLWSLRINFKKIVTLVQKRTFLFVTIA